MLAELPDDVRAELEDKDYEGRSHYSRATYALGCHGPLCRARERDRGRLRNQRRAEDAGREYEPAERLRLESDELLDRIIRWHRPDLFEEVAV